MKEQRWAYIHFLELEGNISVLKFGEGPTERKEMINSQTTILQFRKKH